MNWILTNDYHHLVWSWQNVYWQVRWLRNTKGEVLYYDVEDDIGL